MAECAVEDNTEYYQGIFWSIYMMQAIVGNCIAYFIFTNRNAFGVFFVVMVFVSIVGMLVFSCSVGVELSAAEA